MQDSASFRQPLSLWDISPQEKDYSAPCEPDPYTVDVVIIGGGFTGLSTALHAAEAGLSATVFGEVPGNLCPTTMPELSPASDGGDHLKRCHLVDAQTIYREQVLAVVDPSAVEVSS